MNTDARIEIGQDADGTYRYVAKGQPVEVGMVDFLIENGEDIQQCFAKRNQACPLRKQFPFDPELKRKTVVRNSPTDPAKVRVYVKGAPEEVVPLCSSSVDSQDGRTRIDFDKGM